MQSLSDFLEKSHLKKGFSIALSTVKTVVSWTQERLWPIYSAAMVICVFQMIAVSSEKQILADHYYGASAAEELSDEKQDELVKDSKKFFDEEVTLAVKERVWQLPTPQFKREYAGRYGASV